MRMLRSLLTVALVGLAGHVFANDWGQFAFVSSTMGINDGRLCIGEGTRGDIGCPTYAPRVDNTGLLLTGGISATGTISASAGYFAGNVGIGVPNPTAALDVSNTMRIRGYPSLQLTNSSPQIRLWGKTGTEKWALGVPANGTDHFFIYQISPTQQWRFVIHETTGHIGLGTDQHPRARLDVSGTLRLANGGEACDANRTGAIRYTGGEFSFCRNGTAWETLSSIVQGTADRITSGTTSLVAVSNTGFISLTQAGTNTGWFDPSRGLVTLGVSATGGISATTGYFANTLRVSSSIRIFPSTGFFTELRSHVPSSSGELYSVGNLVLGIGIAGVIRFTTHDGLERMRISSVGNLGIATTTPFTALHVSGTLRLANGGEACDANRTGGIRYTGGEFSFCRNGSAWETLSSIVQGTADRITSGTTSLVAVSNTGFISLTQAGINTGWFDPQRGLVALGVSTTGRISASAGYFAGDTEVSGTLKLGGSNEDTCEIADRGKIRIHPETGHFQLCRL